MPARKPFAIQISRQIFRVGGPLWSDYGQISILNVLDFYKQISTFCYNFLDYEDQRHMLFKFAGSNLLGH